MPRYVAFLRGVSPMNAKMPELKKCFEEEGFTNVVTVLSSGNVVFDARGGSVAALERRIEKAMEGCLDRSFLTIVRSVVDLQTMLESDPFQTFRLGPKAKRIVTFLRNDSPARIQLPIRKETAAILMRDGREVYSAYEPTPDAPVFMALIEKTFGKEVTTRTWDTVRKCALK